MSWLMDAMPWLAHYMIVPMFVLFTSIVIFTYWPGRKSAIERQGQIPFKDDV